MVPVSGNPRLAKVPLVVLVNYGSASASEILAGAIQDHKRGIVMGEQTYGKGSVQELEYFADGSSLRFTVAKWLTPEGRSIDDVGIVPDRIVKFQQNKDNPQADNQLDEAINYLENL